MLVGPSGSGKTKVSLYSKCHCSVYCFLQKVISGFLSSSVLYVCITVAVITLLLLVL